MAARSWSPSALIGSVSRLEAVVGLVVLATLVVLAVAEPGILAAPFENGRTLALSVGGTLVAAVVLVVMLRVGVPPLARLTVLGVPFLAVTWWLVSPFFVDEHVDEEFAVSIADATSTTAAPAPPTSVASIGPVLRGSGDFVGLAGHRGSGRAGVFDLADGSSVLRLEGIDIQNGPDLHLYVVPGRGATSPGDGAVHLGALRGNVGDLTYELPPDAPLGAGPWTVLVWCDAFGVEFVGADVVLA